MAKIQKNFIKGRMNKSVDERLVPQGEYIDALNVRLGSTEGTEIGAVENSKGNELLVELKFNDQPLSVNAKCIGAYEDGATETIYWFINDSTNLYSSVTGKVDMIVSYNTRTFILFYHVISTSVLNFNKELLINGINLIDDLLFFTDNLNPPRKININKTYLEPVVGVDQVTEQDIGVIVAPPLKAPVIDQFQIGGEENYMEDLFLSFAYRWQYEDGEYSAFSPFSPVAFTPGPFNLNYDTYDNDGMKNIFNSVNVSFETGGRNVKDVDVLFKFSTSQTANVIERYNKVDQGWLDNETQNIVFTNKKIYTTLPEEQLLRLYDNVPKIAQAQTIMGNRLMYGNYVDGYDVVSESGQPIYLDYDLSLITENLNNDEIEGTKSDFNYTIDGIELVPNSEITINFGGLDLIAGSQIGIDFNYSNSQFGGDASYVTGGTQPLNKFNYAFLFNIQQNYNSVHDLVTSPEFVSAVSEFQVDCNTGTSVTDIFNCGIVARNEWQYDGFGISSTDQGFSIESTLGSDIVSIVVPGLKFQKYDQTQNPPTPLGVFAYEYLQAIEVTGLYSLDSSKESLHSNRDYEIAIVYMDDYGRSTTALVDTNNTVYVPCENSITKNNIRIQLNNYPPFWAKKYKFVIKESKTGYRTIYSNIFFREEETGFVWYKLDGDNRDKVKDNSNLFVKSDSNGPVLTCTKTKVLDFKSQIEDFLCKKDADGNVTSGTCGQPTGTYMQLKPSNFAANAPANAFIDRTSVGGLPSTGSGYSYARVSCAFEDESTPPTNPPTYTPFDIPAGSIIEFRLNTNRNKRGSLCGSRTYDFNQTFTAGRNYTNLHDFVQSQNIDLTNGVSGGTDNIINVVNQIDTIQPYFTDYINPGTTTISFQEETNGNLWLVIQTGTGKCGGIDGRGSYETVQIVVNRATTLNVFETEPIQANDELYYENNQVFDIVGGFHLSGNSTVDQNQTATVPAIIDLTFYNCYTFGNGAESDRVFDALTTPVLSLGDKVTSVSEEDYKEIHRFADITYSGVFNQESNLNKLNQFNLALANFKTLENSYGPLRKMHARQTDILTLQEDRISYVLTGKNLLSDAAAGGAITSVPEVLGTQLARLEEYGISNNPESFASYGFDVYFTDSKRSSVINLKGGSKGGVSDKLSVISQVGMRSWFRDLFIDSFPTQKLGGFDPYMNEYVLSSNADLSNVPPVERDCGYTLIQQSSTDVISFNLNLTNIIGTVDIDYSAPLGTVRVQVKYNGIFVIDTIVQFIGTLSFSKIVNNPTFANVIITPQVASTYQLDFKCPVANTLRVKQFVVNTPGEVNQTVKVRYNWTLVNHISPWNSNLVVLQQDGVSLSQQQEGLESFGTIPADGSVVKLEVKNQQGSFAFDPLSDKLQYLVSNQKYDEVDINVLIPLLNDATPIQGNTNSYFAEFTYNNPSNLEYLYLVWNLRESNAQTFCYDATSANDACCNCPEP
tara:strand:- start:2408 stop:6775 length:4368 start_codon:yes stop_codon:yes gene_type:complete